MDFRAHDSLDVEPLTQAWVSLSDVLDVYGAPKTVATVHKLVPSLLVDLNRL
jgi:hypothetical protein